MEEPESMVQTFRFSPERNVGVIARASPEFSGTEILLAVVLVGMLPLKILWRRCNVTSLAFLEYRYSNNPAESREHS